MIATIKVHSQTIIEPAKFTISNPGNGLISAQIGALKRLPITSGDILDIVTDDGWYVGKVTSVVVREERVTISTSDITRV